MHQGSKLLAIVAAFAIGAVIGFGCDSSSGGDSSPQGKCGTLVRTLCQRGAACDKTVSAAEEKMCEDDGVKDCSRVATVSPNIDSCVKDLKALSCASFTPDFTPPGSCADALVTVEEQKCRDLSKSLCMRIADCTKDVTVDECVPDVVATLDCADVTQIGPTFEQCLKALMTNTCDALFPMGKLALPMECTEVLVGPGGGSTGGGMGGSGGAGGGKGTGLGGAGGRI
jgi:hypothetical protein